MKIYVHADADTRLVRRIKRDRAMRYESFDADAFMNL
jgi:uridine kinase